MTVETIIKNCNRLLVFLNSPKRESGRTVTNVGGHYRPIDLLARYGLYLDYHGCPKEGLSRIFLPADEYKEMEEWILSLAIEPMYHHTSEYETTSMDGQTATLHPMSIGFLHNETGYYWHIQQEKPPTP